MFLFCVDYLWQPEKGGVGGHFTVQKQMAPIWTEFG